MGGRAPHTWHAPPQLVFGIAVAAAAVALAPLAQWVPRMALGLGPLPGPAPVGEVLQPLAAAAATFVALVLPRGFGLLAARCLIGGTVCGLLAGEGLVLAVARHAPDFEALDVAWSGVVGLAFGAACLVPAREVVEARRFPAASTGDVQIVNTSAWLVIVCTLAASFARSLDALHIAGAIGLGAALTGSLAAARWSLRRRWLGSVARGSVADWRLEHADASASPLPVVELLGAMGSAQVLVWRDGQRTSAYRSPDRPYARARLVPDLRPERKFL